MNLFFRLEEVGIDFVSLKWNAVKEPEGKEVDFLDKVSYMVEIQNTGGKERWSSAYQGKKTHATCENLQSGCEYFSRVKDRIFIRMMFTQIII